MFLSVKKWWGFPDGSVVKNLHASLGDTIQSLIWEDPICCRASVPVHHSYWARALEPGSQDFTGQAAAPTNAHKP